MVAFLSSVIVSLLMAGVIVWYARRRPVGAPVTWGEAMAAATFVFFGLFWVYGVVPHQWLTWAESELGMRPDAYLAGPNATGWTSELPVTISKETVSHLVAVTIYGGSSEIQRNIVATRGLGLPRE